MRRFCFWWSTTEHIAWPTADWTWAECELVADCIRWIDGNVWWKNANWRWSQCSSSVVPPTPPVTESVLQPLGLDAMTLQQPWLEEPWSPYRAADREQEAKRKRLVRLICKVKGIQYDEEKEYKKFQVTADDIKLVVRKVSGIDVDAKLEE